MSKTPKVEVWGTSAGRGSTKEAAYGALTWREYASLEEFEKARNDWLHIIAVSEKEQPGGGAED